MIGIGKGPLRAADWQALDVNPLPYAGLATSLVEEHDYVAELDGKLPRALSGSLYRNGIGRFDRGPGRKRMLLDGDGMVQAFHFEDGRVRYLNRYVRTEKYVRESEAGRYLFPTWSTLAPGGPWKNFGGKLPNQAGTTVVRHATGLYAFDEGQPPYELDPRTLATRGIRILDPLRPHRAFNAHSKWDAATGEWLTLSIAYGKETFAHVLALDPAGKQTLRLKVALPRGVYLHDWFLTARHAVFVLHPAFVSLPALLKVMAGLDTYAESIRWRPREGNVVVVAPRDGTAPFLLETEACWMWHALNAYEAGSEIVADFVGFRDGGGVGTSDSPLYELMRGHAPVLPDEPVATVRRYVLPTASGGRIRAEILAADRNYELPYVARGVAARAYRYAYLASGTPGTIFWTSVARLDTTTGSVERFDFGPTTYTAEPVHAAAPGSDPEAGWLLVPCYDGKTKKSFLAVLDAAHVADGPLATVKLSHHVPMSFHGDWSPAPRKPEAGNPT